MNSIRHFTLLLAGLCLGSTVCAEPVKVLAAGSLTGALGAVIQLYQQQTGQQVQAQFGPAGLLRERIEQGEAVDVFASANMAHPQALAQQGLATPPVVMLRNRLCAKALPAFGLTTDNLLEKLLDPATGLGTSTPKADPGGDYTWLMFARAEKIHPGAQAMLQAKAQQLVGGRDTPVVSAGQNVMDYYFAQHKVDISIGYCSSRQTTPDPRYTSVELPPALAVTADYGLSVVTAQNTEKSAPVSDQQKARLSQSGQDAAYRFVLFVLSPQAQAVMARYGFTPVTDARAE